MNIKINEVFPIVTKQYPYTHRVEVSADALAADKVSAWLDENGINYVSTIWGVYYLRKDHAEWLVLRWG